MRSIRRHSSESAAHAWLFVSLNKRIDNLTVRIDGLYELQTADRKP